MGVDPADLMRDPADRPPVPTFETYIPEVEKAVSPGTAKTYSSYWKRIQTKWGRRNGSDRENGSLPPPQVIWIGGGSC
jgi:hypothetical protein